MLYKAIWIWLVIQIPLGLLVGLTLRAGGRSGWVEEDAGPDAGTVAATAEGAAEQHAG
ncbi:MAG: hypothetical protein ACRYG8_16050 [Janthinobacterium lividum]